MSKKNKSQRRKHGRNNESYDRSSKKYSYTKRILIVCEGAETEPNYFNALKEYFKLPDLIDIKIIPEGGAPITVVETAEKKLIESKQNKEPFEEVWCVFDREGKFDNSSFNRGVNKADTNKYELAISNPAFEFWYLLHFQFTTRCFENGVEIKKHLNSYIPGYTESMDVFSCTKDKLRQAIENSIRIYKNHNYDDERFPNPSTTVHKLVKKLVLMSPSGRAHFEQS